jgi:hypothetical protein
MKLAAWYMKPAKYLEKTGNACGYAHAAVGWRLCAVPSMAPIEVEPGWTTWGRLEVNLTVILILS